MSFQIAEVKALSSAPELAIVFVDGKFFVKDDAESQFALLFEHTELVTHEHCLPEDFLLLGTWHGRKVTLVLKDHLTDPEAVLDQSRGLREMLPFLDAHVIKMATRASQLANWVQTHRFCGVCGADGMKIRSDSALVCSNCGHAVYPRLSPCVIGVVTRGNEILLAQGVRHKGRYSCLAGFIEAGETPEQAFQREVFEEVGLRVRNVQYMVSQSWPFPDQLMLGFKAEYEFGDICIDENEIIHADWFTTKQLPELPPEFTISRQIISSVLKELG